MSNASVDMKLEVDILPVSDVKHAKEFYSKIG
jgi:predicted lactoylglutathione lyase